MSCLSPRRTLVSKRIGLAFAASVVVACSAGTEDPSPGTYTLKFPSTAAAVSTDTVQIVVFEAPPPGTAQRAGFCQELVQARRRKDPQREGVPNPAVNICELLQGRKPLTIPYGEKALLAIAQRKGADFMIGCAIQTLGEGDAPLPIDLALIDVSNPVPETNCSSVGDFCASPPKCTPP